MSTKARFSGVELWCAQYVIFFPYCNEGRRIGVAAKSHCSGLWADLHCEPKIQHSLDTLLEAQLAGVPSAWSFQSPLSRAVVSSALRVHDGIRCQKHLALCCFPYWQMLLEVDGMQLGSQCSNCLFRKHSPG